LPANKRPATAGVITSTVTDCRAVVLATSHPYQAKEATATTLPFEAVKAEAQVWPVFGFIKG
jgi:hypothetical protein